MGKDIEEIELRWWIFRLDKGEFIDLTIFICDLNINGLVRIFGVSYNIVLGCCFDVWIYVSYIFFLRIIFCIIK